MRISRRWTTFRWATVSLVIPALLNGCLMGEEESKSSEETAFDHVVTGSVGDGPIVGASMRVFRSNGEEIAQFESDSNANFSVTVRADGKDYPLAIDSRGGTDLVTNSEPDFDLIGAVIEPGDSSIANVNPFTTFAIELAAGLPGAADKTNVETAENIVASKLNFGLDSLVTSGVMNTAIDGGNIAEIVRASEALGETVRRTRDALISSGYATDGNSVLRAISSDLVDGMIDGVGGPQANARFAAVWIVVSAQVSLETMANELHVNGGNATALMSTAMELVSNGNISPTLAELDSTTEMIEQARIGLQASHAISADTDIADLLDAANGIHSGASSSTIRNLVLPDDYRVRLDNAILLVAGGDNSVVDA
ncbi:MAG: hypothetical protein KJP16_08840, partial [Gammaproteobacteria bacterium]|nr:hypothetical protein [Gammaproteobacteria bacterium]NNL50911.1 hypothetical protein [Woeseiaceae bacterium]